MEYKITGAASINGEIRVPGDKSISHRSLLVGSIARGTTEIEGFLMSGDCMSTLNCLRACGVDIQMTKPGSITVHGKGLKGMVKPDTVLDAGNSGTTIRLLSGILCAQDFDSIITGDSSLVKRPMDRITTPLSLMGASIECSGKGLNAPLKINGKKLHGISYAMPIASAQVKSSILLASLFADEATVIIEPLKTRDHTEIMLNRFGALIKRNGPEITSSPVNSLYGQKITVPGDISSAAYFIVASLIIPNSSITIRDVGLNPTRTGILDALSSMGASIIIENLHIEGGEPVGDITAASSSLKGISIQGSLIPRLIDEIPVLCVAAAFAEGTTVISGAQELKFKESDRIKAMACNLKLLGADVREMYDGLVIEGGCKKLHGSRVKDFNDHRVIMAMAVAGLAIKYGVTLDNTGTVSISFPGFFETVEKIKAK